jgi:hypothetical protein
MRKRGNNHRILNRNNALHTGGNVLSNLTNVVDKFFNGQEIEGEKHAISLSGPNKGQVHQFTGPRTNLDVRLARGDQGINDLDRSARAHDIAYRDSLNQYANTKDKKAFLKQVWNADDVFVKNAFNSKDDPITGKIAGSLIKGKQLAEKAGILDTKIFSGAGNNITTDTDPVKSLRMSYKPSKVKYGYSNDEDDTQVGGFPIGPLISVLATVAPPIIEYVWNKVHSKKGGAYYGKGSEDIDTEDKRAILLSELSGVDSM